MGDCLIMTQKQEQSSQLVQTKGWGSHDEILKLKLLANYSRW